MPAATAINTPLRRSPPSADGGRRLLLAGANAVDLETQVRRLEPDADLEVVETTLDALAEVILASRAQPFDVVLADAQEPDEVDALREALDESGPPAGRLILTRGSSSLLSHGADHVLVDTPTDAAIAAALKPAERQTHGPSAVPELDADVLLDAQIHHPGKSVKAAVQSLDRRLGGGVLVLAADAIEMSVPIPSTKLHLAWTAATCDDAEADVIRHELALLASRLGKMAELDQRHVKLKRLALTDELTGCATRRLFQIALDDAIKNARRERYPVTLLLFDIDNFKQYNDQYGHAVGDAILKQTGTLIRRCVRDGDFVARIGGDEFAVIFRDRDEQKSNDGDELRRSGQVPDGPRLIAERFRRLIGSSDFNALGTSGLGRLTISGGMAVFPYDANDASGLVDQADKAMMFGAKRGGKDVISLVEGDA
jgi:diguanylate cyclase (GGDEF)-like protein